ncbi:MAG TPA: hypothetical protein VHH35_07940 [Pyrinomonadaceae bacterium]|nr:hypothetical protein [Pyrinomonadaceae bacterium]
MLNPRIISAEPLVFAPFAGWCVLFDNHGPSIRQVKWGGQLLDTDPNAEANLLYTACWRTLERNKTVDLCPLPVHSAHVTFNDCVHAGNLHKISGQQHERWLTGLPQTTRGALPEEVKWMQSELASLRSFRLFMKFDRIDIHEQWSSLVCKLKAADAVSETVIEELRNCRAKLDQHLVTTLGKPPNDRWSPHVSIAYFVSQEAASSARENLPHLNEAFVEETEGLTLEFTNLAIYAFEDMTSFWRVPPAEEETPRHLLRERSASGNES